MLDYKFIKDNLEAVKKNISDRNMTADADIVVELYDKRTKLVTDRQALQEKRNANAQSMKQKLEPEQRQALIEEGKKIKDELAEAEKVLAQVEAQLDEAARKIPNMASPKEDCSDGLQFLHHVFRFQQALPEFHQSDPVYLRDVCFLYKLHLHLF